MLWNIIFVNSKDINNMSLSTDTQYFRMPVWNTCTCSIHNPFCEKKPRMIGYTLKSNFNSIIQSLILKMQCACILMIALLQNEKEWGFLRCLLYNVHILFTYKIEFILLRKIMKSYFIGYTLCYATLNPFNTRYDIHSNDSLKLSPSTRVDFH